jgi:predicted AlkP superfamily pyrophosphatase or phosphodiesterase
LKQVRPQAKTVALVSWLPFVEHVFSAEEGCRLVADGDKVGYESADRAVAEQAVQVLRVEDPDAMFVYFGDVDINGHGYGFHPKAPRYTAAVERVDEHIGKILEALRGRPNYASEDWLIMVCTDHGGRGKDHGDGKNVPEIRLGFLIMTGASVQPGKIEGRHFNVDIAATALKHLGVPINSDWKFDGEALGLK